MIRELHKRCDCPRARWPKCPHGFHVRKMIRGRRWAISLDEWLGHEEVRSAGAAEAVARPMIDAMKAGTFSPIGPAGTVAVRAAQAAGGDTFAAVAAAYQTIVNDDPERKTSYKKNLGYMITLVTGWRIPDRAETLGALPIGSIDTALITRFYKAQVAAGKSASYRNKMVQFCRHFSRWAVREGYRTTEWIAPDDASHSVKRRTPARRHRRLALPDVDAAGRVLVAGEYERLLDAADPRLQDLCIASVESGGREAELTRLIWRDVDLARGTLKLWDPDDPENPKRRTRVLPLSPTLAAVLDRRRWGPDGVKLPPHAHVFGNAIGERVGKISTAWETAVLKAHGVPVTRDPRTHALTAAARAAYAAIDLVFPDLRHEAASRWLERGLRLEEISHLLGHTSYETTRIYLNARPEDLAARFLAVATAAGADAGKFGARLAQTAETERKPVLKMVSKNRRKPRKSKDLA